MADAQNMTPKSMELYTYLWNEYKYRHKLCWEAVYKLAAAVIALAILPYLKKELTASVGPLMSAPAGIALLLAIYGILVVRNELEIFARVKVAHHTLQNELFDELFNNQDHVRTFVRQKVNPHNAKRTPFDRYVYTLVGVLVLLTLLNAWFVTFVWIPRVLHSPSLAA